MSRAFTDFAQGSDSEKNAIDPNYESAFLNAERTIAESDAMRYFQVCVGAVAPSAATGAFAAGPAAPIGALKGAALGCGQNITGEAVIDLGAPEQVVRTGLTIIDWFGYSTDIFKGISRRLPQAAG